MADARGGSDGSDGKYRMIIENHYQQMASSRQAFLSAFRLQMAHFALALLLAATLALFLPRLPPASPQQGSLEEEGEASLSLGEVAWLLGLPLLHAALALYGRQALRANAAPALRTYALLASILAGACLLAGLHRAFFGPPSTAPSHDRLAALLHHHAPVGLAMLGAAAGLTSALHARRFVHALAATKKTPASSKRR